MSKIFVVPSVLPTSQQGPTEFTSALLCEQQAFKTKKSRLSKLRLIFCLKSCIFQKFVVNLQRFS